MKINLNEEINDNIICENNFLEKIFYCCSGLKEKTPEIQFEFYNNNDPINSSIFPNINKFIRIDEADKIKYSKKGILDFIYSLQNLEFSKKYESEIYKISTRDSSILSKDSLLIRYEAKIDKKLFIKETPKLIELFDGIKNPYKNLKWNIFNKEYTIIENIDENVDIVKKISVKQMNIIPEKEFYNKRIFFLDGGNIYYFTSSIPDNIYPPKDDNYRGINYFEIFVIKEEKDCFLFDIFQQIDIKMSIPQTFLMINLPEKLSEYFEKLIEFFNS